MYFKTDSAQCVSRAETILLNNKDLITFCELQHYFKRSSGA